MKTGVIRGESALGILAGGGVYPEVLVRRLLSHGYRVVVAGMQGQTRETLRETPVLYREFPLGRMKEMARFYLENGVKSIFFAGGVNRAGAWKNARPDLMGWRLLLKALFGGDDQLLREVASCFAGLGIEVGDPLPFINDLFAEKGRLAGPAPSQEIMDMLDIARQGAVRAGGRDQGQAAVATKQSVWKVETRAGTDGLLRAGPPSGAVLAKVVKPGQDRRFDMPAIGPDTVKIAHEVALAAIGVEAEGVLIFEKRKVLNLCDKWHISLIGFPSGGPITV